MCLHSPDASLGNGATVWVVAAVADRANMRSLLQKGYDFGLVLPASERLVHIGSFQFVGWGGCVFAHSTATPQLAIASFQTYPYCHTHLASKQRPHWCAGFNLFVHRTHFVVFFAGRRTMACLWPKGCANVPGFQGMASCRE